MLDEEAAFLAIGAAVLLLGVGWCVVFWMITGYDILSHLFDWLVLQ